MLVTQQPVFRQFWYPVMPYEQLKEGRSRLNYSVSRWYFG